MVESKKSLIQVVTQLPTNPKRLDVWLAQMLQLSRSRVQQLLVKNSITINGQSINSKTKPKLGDQITLLPEAKNTDLELPDIPILYEDDDILVVNKPSGLKVHAGNSLSCEITLVDCLRKQATKLSSGLGDPTRQGIVHRLDQFTSGVLICAKNDPTHIAMQNIFRQRQVEKEYLALLCGIMPDSEIFCESYLYRDPKHRKKFASTSDPTSLKETRSRLAISTFQRIATYDPCFSLAKVFIKTGRTHQIRVHAKALHLPIIGDQLYFLKTKPLKIPSEIKQIIANLRGQVLHARRIKFFHPTHGKIMSFKAPINQGFHDLLLALAPYRKPRFHL